MRRRSAAALTLAAALLTAARAQWTLHNATLRCCVLLEEPYTRVDVTKAGYRGFSGLAIDYLLLLQTDLSFSCETLGVFKPSTPENKGFSGFVRELGACAPNGSSAACSCDLGVAAFSLTTTRASLVDFVAPFTADNFQMATRASLVQSRSRQGVFFFTAFSPGVWLAVAALACAHVAVAMFDATFMAPPPPGSTPAPPGEGTAAAAGVLRRVHRLLLKQRLLYRLRHSLYSTVMHLLGQHTGGGPAAGRGAAPAKQRARHRVMNILALLFGLFVFTVYQASLTVQLFLTEQRSVFSSIADLKTCRVDPATYTVCLTRGGGAEIIYENSLAPSECLRNRPDRAYRLLDTFEDGFYGLKDGSCDFFYESGGLAGSTVKGQFCRRLELVGEPFFDHIASFVLPKSSPLTANMSMSTFRLREQDVLVSTASYLASIDCAPVVDGTVGWDKMRIFFYSCYAAFGAMLLVMLIGPGRRRADGHAPAAPPDGKP
jgi:hypothetical protein